MQELISKVTINKDESNFRIVIDRETKEEPIIKLTNELLVNEKELKELNLKIKTEIEEKTKQEKINYIMRNFDFDRVLKVMTYLNWTYLHEPVTMEIIQYTARRMLRECIDDPKEYIFYSTGGFKATKDEYGLTLDFVLSEYSVNEI